MNRSGSLALPFAALALLGGCGGDSDEKAAPTAKPAETTEAAEGKTFKADDVGFTFSYPDGFEQLDEPNDGEVVATVTPTPTDPKNGLKVRVTATSELAFDSYAAKIRKQFEDQLATDVAMTTETRGDLELGVLSWTKPFTFSDLGQEETTQLKSTSYFFVAGGKTWQLECLSTSKARTTIDAACKQAVESIRAG